MRAARAAGVLLLVVGLLATTYVVRALWQDDHRPTVARQIAYLQQAIAAGRGADMQQLFPEGEFFTHALTGLAAGNLARQATDPHVRRGWLDVEEQALSVIDTDRLKAPFGTIPALEHGIFYRGWRLLLIADVATIDDGTGRMAKHAPRATTEADAIVAAVRASRTGFVDGYPGQAWPCDTVVGLAAAHRAGQDVSWWPARVSAAIDPATGLLAHRIDQSGRAVEPARGSSQSIIQTFWPDVDPSSASEQWGRFRDAFVVREAGLVGVREYPRGVDGQPDVDSGPLVLGVSASASAVTLAAAKAHGDTTLAWGLEAEADLLGFPLDLPRDRRYAFGVLPVGDAFLAWARSTPATEQSVTGSPLPWWGLWVALAAIPLVGGVVVLRSTRRRNRPGIPDPAHG